MHVDFAKEKLEYAREQAKKWKCSISADSYWASSLLEEKEFLQFLIEYGNELSKLIAETLKSKIGSKYFRVTDKQKSVVVNDILNRFTAEEIIEKTHFLGKQR